MVRAIRATEGNVCIRPALSTVVEALANAILLRKYLFRGCLNIIMRPTLPVSLRRGRSMALIPLER